jgi:phenylacetic acid degradation operon negative regulatory protein
MHISADNSAAGLTPRKLILEMLDADPVMMANGRRLIAAGTVFGFSENQIRVALSRLLADGLLMQPCRGDYALDGAATRIQVEAQRWQKIESRLRRWRGDWCAVLTENLAAEGSTQFRRQSRALALRGMQRWRPGLWVRPNNLRGGPERLGEELLALGLDAIRGQCVIEQPDPGCEMSLQSLWNPAQLEETYSEKIDELLEATSRLERPRSPAVLGETLELGGNCIRALLRDPLLPDELASGDRRRQLTGLLKDYDKKGRIQWRQFIQQL